MDEVTKMTDIRSASARVINRRIDSGEKAGIRADVRLRLLAARVTRLQADVALLMLERVR